MAVVVFDADVLIAFLGRDDANHGEAVERMRSALEPGFERLVSAVNYSEVLIGPLQRLGAPGARAVDSMFSRLGIETVPGYRALARKAAAVRARTGLKLPDAYALATAIDAASRERGEVRLDTFDQRVASAFAALRGQPFEP